MGSSATGAPSLIKARGLTKYYDDQPAIKDVSFDITPGNIVGLLGLNGAGKSTVLKILGTFLTPSNGEAFVDGYSVEEDGDKVRTLIGYLPDKPPLYDEMTATDYLRFVAKLKGVKAASVEQHVNDALRETNTLEVAETKLGALSHGFRQRVGIAQAIVHRPKLLILDEPINGLDPIQIVEMRDLILSLKGKHTVILSSHILSEITKTCDHILIIDHGSLVAQGHPDDLLAHNDGAITIAVEFAKSSSLEPAKLNTLPWIRKVTQKAAQGEGYRVEISLVEDRRAELVKHLVHSGVEVLAFNKAQEGLEAVFMGLVKGQKKETSK